MCLIKVCLIIFCSLIPLSQATDFESECGLATPTNKYPWVVGIYYLSEELLCDGIIISRFHIVTAASCLFERPKNVIATNGDVVTKLERFEIIAGKHYINLHKKKNSQQNRRVKNAFVYGGNAFKYFYGIGNIVLVEVEEEFKLSDDVRPACVDWQLLFEEWDIQQKNEGTLVGLEYDQDEVVSCDVSGVRYWPKNICWLNLPKGFRKLHFDSDKFCAQYIDRAADINKCKGTGLFFQSNRQRYFLTGLVGSVNPGTKSYVLYTKMSSYVEWLKLEMRKNQKYYFTFETIEQDVYDNSEGCTLPKHVEYGKFTLVLGTAYPEGIKVPSLTLILLLCEDDKTIASFRCLDKEWAPLINEAVCKKPGTCPSLIASESEEVFCKYNGSPTTCEEPPNNTTAVAICNPYYSFFGHRPIYKCQNGKWDPPFVSCYLECGTKRTGATTLAIGGTETLVNEYPWVVAVYHKGIHVCGATLISRYYVISAAHCFTTSKGIRKQKDDYTVIAGKYYRDINIEEKGSQSRKIASLYVHEDYKGSVQRYRDDIAIMELYQKFTVSEEVQPICIDWESAYEDLDFTIGKVGVVAGWGFTHQAGSPSDVLKKLVVPFQPKDVCLENLPEDFSYQFVATDKICAGYKDNNTNVCKGDSGGGLYFRSDGARFFLRGIVSLSVKSTVGCDTNHFSLYTKVSKYLPWIADITRKVL